MQIISASQRMRSQKAVEAIKGGACIVTDTQMAKSGINKRALARYGGEVFCFMSDEDVAGAAKRTEPRELQPAWKRLLPWIARSSLP